MQIIDGGYLSWVYGTIPHNAWDHARHEYRGDLICMDSQPSESWRLAQSPDYKSRRAGRRLLDPAAAIRKERVTELRSLMMEDPLVHTCYLEGFEADDLVALHWLIYPEARVLGEDKDLLQVPGLYRKMHNLQGKHLESLVNHRRNRLPMYYPGTRHARDVLLFQLFFGDKTDSIPRLTYKKDARLINSCYHDDEPFAKAYHYLGDPVIESLKLLLVPCLGLHREIDRLLKDPRLLLRELDSGMYWTASNFYHPDHLGCRWPYR